MSISTYKVTKKSAHIQVFSFDMCRLNYGLSLYRDFFSALRLFARFFVVVGEEGLELFFGGVADLVAAVKSVAAQAWPQLVGVFDGFAHGVGGGALGVHLLHPCAQGRLCAARARLVQPATRHV